MTLMLKVALLAISAVQMCAQAKQPSVAKLRADAQMSRDSSAATNCEIFELGDQIDDEQDAEKAEELRQKAAKLEEALGPEF
jgi:hypothetical protein